MIEIGLKHTSELTVTDAVTAIKMGSGDMPVLAMHSLARAHTLDSLLIENILCQNFDMRAVVHHSCMVGAD